MKLLILDCDGVLTDGSKIYTNDGCVAKRFNDQDFTAINRFKEDGVYVCVLSADKNVTANEMARRGIDFWYSKEPDGTIDKVRFLPIFEKQYNVTIKDMVYVGDDFFDIPIMKAVVAAGGRAICPVNACSDIINDNIASPIRSKCGEFVVAEIYRLFQRGFIQ